VDTGSASRYAPGMTIVLRILAWLLAVAVTFVTLGPPQYRPHSDFGQAVEHALAFVLIGLAFGFAYPRQRLLTVGVAVLMIGALEVLQLFAPGRHARIEDFAVDALAACAGFALVAALTVSGGASPQPKHALTQESRRGEACEDS
jgi:VanZ family protein